MDLPAAIMAVLEEGFKPETLFTIFLAMIVIYTVMSIRAFLVSLHAWNNFKSSLNICLGTMVRMPTSTGYSDGVIIRADRRRIVIEMDDTIKFVPTKTFMERDWDILKKGSKVVVSNH